MDAESQLFVRFGDRETQEPLRKATVSSQADLKYVLRFGCSFHAEIGSPVILFHQIERRFFSQPGKVESICLVSQTETVVTITCESEPVPAENRTAFRAVTVGRQVTATVGRERGCEVVNVSASGLAVMMKNPPKLGTAVEIILQMDKGVIRGHGTLRNCIPMSCRRYKCGFHVQDKQLSTALNTLCMSVQREQLKRLARA